MKQYKRLKVAERQGRSVRDVEAWNLMTKLRLEAQVLVV